MTPRDGLAFALHAAFQAGQAYRMAEDPEALPDAQGRLRGLAFKWMEQADQMARERDE
jgi:hypothetical protein